MRFGGRRLPLAPDPEVIRALAGLLGETGLTEIEYAVGDHRIRVAREPGERSATAANGHAAPAAEPGAPAEGEAAAGEAAANGAVRPGMITSPIVGVAYLAPEPGAAPFVQLGDRVGEGQTLLIIEAMKVMNQIRAPRAGRVARILVADADPVEYGAPLMLIEQVLDRYFIYILTNDRHTVLYTGVTSNLQVRAYQHREKLHPGFTARYNVYKLVYYEAFNDPATAIAREKQIKGGSRQEKIDLIDGFNPEWRDLYHGI